MSSSAGQLDFFVLEASECAEQLDGLLAAAGASGPSADAFARTARVLRGSATMAKLQSFADLAGAVERVARALRDGQLGWDAALRGVLTSAVDDCKILVRGARNWGSAEEQRARARLAELTRWAPAARTPTPAMAMGGNAFLAGETAEIAAALEALGARPTDRGLLMQALARARALRGVAAIRDLPPLPDVVDAVERAAKPIELGRAGTPEQLALLAAAAGVLRRITGELRAGQRPDPAAPEVRRFADAAAAAEDALADADRIVPIAELFPADGGENPVQVAPNPPTTPAERFRLEVVSQAEHLRRLVGDARSAVDPATRERLARELRAALRALRRGAESFGEKEVAQFVAAMGDAAASLDALALGALDEVAALLANPATRSGDLAQRVDQLTRGRQLDRGIGAGMGVGAPAGTGEAGSRAAEAERKPAPARPVTGDHALGGDWRQTARPTPSEPTTTPPLRPTTVSPTPTGRALAALLQTSIQGLDRLTTHPMSEPVPIDEDSGVVPIALLLYRGPDALARAREVRDEIRRQAVPPTDDQLAELFDLLDLAAPE